MICTGWRYIENNSFVHIVGVRKWRRGKRGPNPALSIVGFEYSTRTPSLEIIGVIMPHEADFVAVLLNSFAEHGRLPTAAEVEAMPEPEDENDLRDAH